MPLYEGSVPANVLAVDADDGVTLINVKRDDGIFISRDIGVTWHRLHARETCHVALQTVAAPMGLSRTICAQAATFSPKNLIDPESTEDAVRESPTKSARGHRRNTRPVFCSTDGGRSWQTLPVPAGYLDFASPPIADGKAHRLYATLIYDVPSPGVRRFRRELPELRQTVAFTDDFGQSWTMRPELAADRLSLVLTAEATPRRLLARYTVTGFDQLLECDAKLDCNTRFDPSILNDLSEQQDLADLVVSPFNPNEMVFSGALSLHVSRDGGARFDRVAVAGGLSRKPIYLNGDTPSVLVSLYRAAGPRIDASYLLVSRDGGTTWTRADKPLPEASGDLVADAKGHLFFVGDHIHRSDDAGLHFRALN